MMCTTRNPERSRLRLTLIAGAIAAITLPTAAQVVPPPREKPETTPKFEPPRPVPPRQPRPAMPRNIAPPDVEFDPITRRDAEGNIIEVREPIEYVAMAHNPLMDLQTLAKIGPALVDRRRRMEQTVISNVGVLRDIENGLIRDIRTTDEDSFRNATMRLLPLLTSIGTSAMMTPELVTSGAVPPPVGALTQKITGDHRQQLTDDAIDAPTEDGAISEDRMMHVTLETSLSEVMYFYDELLMEAAAQFGAIYPELELTQNERAEIDPLAAKLSRANDLDERADLIREIFDRMPVQTRQAALRMVRDSREPVDAAALLVIPEGAIPRELDDQTRMEIIMSLVDGVKIDTSSLVD